MKKILSIILSVIIVVSSISFAITSFAQDEISSIEKTPLGTTNTYYEYNSASRTLTISGEGATPNYSSNGQGQPWYDWRTSYIDKVIVEEGVTIIGNYLFYQVQANEYTLPSTLTKIGDYSFYAQNKLQAIDIPFGVTSIGKQTFKNCINLKSINPPHTLLTIGANAFEGCKALAEITIPYSVTSLGTKAFLNCTTLSRVNFESLTASVKIGDYCFMGCGELKELYVPLNASISQNSYSYRTTSAKYTDTTIFVFYESDGYNNAVASSMNYSLIDTIDIDLAVAYTNAYTESNLAKKYIYRFVPKTTEVYNFYTRGKCDVDAVLCDKNGVIATGDDISESDRNFCITKELTAEKEYFITITSVKSQGSYTLWAYPNNINSIDVKATPITVTAKENMKSVDDNLLEKFTLTINFTNGLQKKLYYKNDFFNGRYLKQSDVDFTCGENMGRIEIGDVYCEYPLTIVHTYTTKEVDYTVDNDGYTLHYCVLCGDSFKENFVPTPSIKVVGRLVFSEDKNANHESNKPFTYIEKIVLDDKKSITTRTYYLAEDGSFELHSFNSFDVEFINEHSKNVKFSINTESLEPYTVIDCGDIVVNAYDFNCDNKVNAKDYAIYIKEKRTVLPTDYMEFFIKHI